MLKSYLINLTPVTPVNLLAAAIHKPGAFILSVFRLVYVLPEKGEIFHSLRPIRSQRRNNLLGMSHIFLFAQVVPSVIKFCLGIVSQCQLMLPVAYLFWLLSVFRLHFHPLHGGDVAPFLPPFRTVHAL